MARSGPKQASVSISEARQLLTHDFWDAGIDSAAMDAKLLVSHAAGLDSSELIAQGLDIMEPDAYIALSELAARRLSGEPISQILGYRDFWKDRFTVTPDVLTPRPETEGIIEQALELCPSPPKRILDLGTGSGAIILSLLREFDKTRGVAVDISDKALAVSRGNAQNLNLAARCDFIRSDWFENVPQIAGGEFDLIVSNPPYITSDEMAELPKDVAEFEPHLALNGGDDGLGPYRIIARQAGEYLKPCGSLILEIGYLQGADVAELLTQAGLMDVEIHKDLAGHDRIVTARKTSVKKG